MSKKINKMVSYIDRNIENNMSYSDVSNIMKISEDIYSTYMTKTNHPDLKGMVAFSLISGYMLGKDTKMFKEIFIEGELK